MRAELVGTAQDGGVPHLGYNTESNRIARERPEAVRNASSLKVYDEERGINYLFEASPDIRHQIKEDYIDGIFLSHGELGTVTGLLYLGRESINANEVPVYCTDDIKEFLKDNYMFRVLMDRNNIDVNTYDSEEQVELMGLEVTPVPVVHEYVPTDTHAFLITTEDTTLLYMTDIDYWNDAALHYVERADIAIVDGTFWSEEEIDRYERVPHPPIKESLEKLADMDTRVIFSHLNHTNPALDPDSEERQKVEDAGFEIAEEGMEIEL